VVTGFLRRDLSEIEAIRALPQWPRVLPLVRIFLLNAAHFLRGLDGQPSPMARPPSLPPLPPSPPQFLHPSFLPHLLYLWCWKEKGGI